MASTIVRNGETDKLQINRPFKGLTIALASVLNTPLSSVNPANAFPASGFINPFKIQLSLRNLNTGVELWNWNLGSLFTFFNYQKQNLAYIISPLTPAFGSVSAPIGCQNHFNVINNATGIKSYLRDFSFEFGATYQGDYELVIQAKDSIPLGSSANSFISITPEWSDQPMNFELALDYKPLNASTNPYKLGNGIEQILIVKETQDFYTMNTTAMTETLYKNIDSVKYSSSSGRDEQMNNNEVRVLTNSFFEDASIIDAIKAPLLVVHDEEINNDMEVRIDLLTPTNEDYLVYTRLYRNVHAEASALKSEQNYNETVSKMLNN